MAKRIKALINFFLIKIYYLIWVLVHFVYRCQADIREKLETNGRHVFKRLISCLPSYSYHGELTHLNKCVEKLNKIPKHIAISVFDNNGSGKSDEIDLQMLGRVISWAWVTKVPVVSIYDYHGRLKNSYRELGCYVQEEVIQNFWALKKFGKASEPPSIKFHNVPKVNGYSNGVGSNGLKATNVLHIAVFSKEDGKPEIIKTATQHYFDQIKHEGHDDGRTESCSDDVVSISNLNEEKWDSILNRSNSAWLRTTAGATSEPEILLILGSIKSTLGFLPWHIRLTEIYWLPKLALVETRDFLTALKTYSRCQQRFGT